MTEPAPVERARAVLRHIQKLGGPLSQYCVCVSKAEGFELIDWLREQVPPANLELLDADILEAKEQQDPWIVLREFNLLGLAIERLDRLN